MLTIFLNLVLLGVYVGTSTSGLVLMKRAMASKDYVSLVFALGLGLYVAGFGLWVLVLQRLPLSLAFPLASGALIVATQVAGILWLGEKMSPLHAAGSVLILLGLGVIALAGARA